MHAGMSHWNARPAGNLANGYWSGIMTRYACVFLPYWPIERLLREKRRKAHEKLESSDRPLALIASQAGGFRLTAVNDEAAQLSLTTGELLADARARVPALETCDADPDKDREALIKLARWCGRFSPHSAPWPEEERSAALYRPTLQGLTLDITGCAHLFGGEENLAENILSALNALGITARLSLADTIGAAHALACYGKTKCLVVPPGKEADAIKSLSVAALRLSNKNAAGLFRVGLKRIGDLYSLPRANLTKRFGPEILSRLEQALGKAPEPLSPLLPHAPYRANAVLAEPICSEEHVLTLIKKLCADIAPLLTRDGKGARALLLSLFRVDGEIAELAIGMAEAANDPEHIAKLFSLKLNRLAQEHDAGFGYEAARLDVLKAETITHRQNDIGSEKGGRETNLHHFIDRLGSKLGVENVLRLHLQESHIPERAVIMRPAAYHRDAQWEETPSLPRPLMMLPCAEPADVVAILPEGPPRQFRWRKVLYTITDAEGPERIRPEWWREKNSAARERDYYIVEDEEGRRFWLYREGLYDAPTPPRWFVQGVFT
nr:MAG: DNA polymerase Y family protein [Hyphomicrobiales bacterium]